MTKFNVELTVDATLLKNVIVEAANEQEAVARARALHQIFYLDMMAEQRGLECELYDTEIVDSGKLLSLRIYDRESGSKIIYEENGG